MFHAGLGRDGPGLLLRDIRRSVSDILTARDAILATRPDILLLLDFDHDLDGVGLRAFADLLDGAGHAMPHRFALRPNAGVATGLDLDGDGQRGGPGDAQGWGRFAGAGGMAILSRLPLDASQATDHSGFLWRDLPGARLPVTAEGAPFPSTGALAIQRLASVGAWEVPVVGPNGDRLTLLVWHAGPPVFGGPEGRNRLRNADQNAFWRLRLEGGLGVPPETPLVLMGNANLDPEAGDGIRAEMRALLDHPALQDPAPEALHPGLDGPSRATAWWPGGPGALRVDYLLPGAGLEILDSGLHWPPDGTHALIWADIRWPP